MAHEPGRAALRSPAPHAFLDPPSPDGPDDAPSSAGAEAAARRFLLGRGPLTDTALIGLHQGLYLPALVHRLAEASRAGARLAAGVPAADRDLRALVDHPAFDWGGAAAGGRDLADTPSPPAALQPEPGGAPASPGPGPAAWRVFVEGQEVTPAGQGAAAPEAAACPTPGGDAGPAAGARALEIVGPAAPRDAGLLDEEDLGLGRSGEAGEASAGATDAGAPVAIEEAAGAQAGDAAARPATEAVEPGAATGDARQAPTASWARLGKEVLRGAKVASDVLRLPGALRQAAGEGRTRFAAATARRPVIGRAWDAIEVAAEALDRQLVARLPAQAPEVVEHVKHGLGYLTVDLKTIGKHLAAQVKDVLHAAAEGEHAAAAAVASAVPVPVSQAAASVEGAAARAATATREALAGTRSRIVRAVGAALAGGAAGGVAGGLRAAVERTGALERAARLRAVVQDAARAALEKAGGGVASKGLVKAIPVVGNVVSAGAAGLDVYQAYREAKEGNHLGAIIEGLHAVTDAAGVFPVGGAAISLAGDALSILAHWATRR